MLQTTSKKTFGHPFILMLSFASMLLPFIGFIAGCVVFTILGSIVLGCIPTLRLTAVNLLLFVIGAFPGALALPYLYGRIFASSNNQLTSRTAVLGLFGVILVGAIAGGAGLVWLRIHFVRTTDCNSSHP